MIAMREPSKFLFMSGDFFEELQRRKVYRVAAAYIIAAGFIIQMGSAIFPAWELPNWTFRLVVVLLLIGFPIALILAWDFDVTPEGIRATKGTAAETHLRRNVIILAVTGVIVSVAAGFFLLPRASPPNIDKSIAVLPFQNLSGDPDNAYFANGIQDEILTRLSKISDLKVIARTSVQHYQSKPENLPTIGKQLGVAYFLEGSVQKSADAVRVNVQLIKAANDSHLWADTFDRKLTDIFAVETEIAKTVADTLQARLTGSEKRAIAAKPTENPEAHELYLKGRFFWNKRTNSDLKTAIQYFNQAIEKDPGYALAYAGLADAYAILTAYAAAPVSESLPRAELVAKKALELDDSLAEAHTSLGLLLFYNLDFQGV